MVDRASSGRELQVAVVAALSRLGRGTAAEVRDELGPRLRREYTTIATVLTRLAARGVVGRSKERGVWVYEPRGGIGDFVAGIIDDLLTGLDPRQRREALASICRASSGRRSATRR
jgi:predicted transcriptional regulator